MVKKRHKQTSIDVAIGDFVLCGGTSASYPGCWYVGSVLFIAGPDVLIRRDLTTGGIFHEVIHVSTIRAHGTISEINEAQRTASEHVKELLWKVRDAEKTLSCARDALWKHLEELTKSHKSIIAPDFDEIETVRKESAKIYETLCAEADVQFTMDFPDA